MYAFSPAEAARPEPVRISSTIPSIAPTRQCHRRRTAARLCYPRRVRLVIARCSVDYVGRLSAHLPLATRLLMVKADGSVSIHADDRAYKPLNWMSPPCRVEEAPGVWRVVNKAGEELRITLEEISRTPRTSWASTPGCSRTGWRRICRSCWPRNPATCGEGFTLVRREYMTAIGPVDLLCRDGTAAPWRSRSSGAAKSTGWNSSPATWNCSTAIRC